MTEHADYDSPWKEMLERYFEEFLEFFFPDIHQKIDWGKGYEFLDKELQQVVRDAALGKRLVDKLVKVYTPDEPETEEIWVFIHIEVQGFYEKSFQKRMYTYNYRLFDRYDQPICSLAVLADEREHWKPDTFRYDMWGCRVSITFPVVKLLDYQQREEELEESTNPFAMIVLAYLKTLETKKQADLRFQWKLRLYKLLYERGFTRQDILELTHFMDWIMVLPKALEQRFDETITQYEEEQRMKYVTSFERIGLEKGMLQGLQQGMQQGLQQGLQQGIQQGLQQGLLQRSREDVIEVLYARFEKIPSTLITSIHTINDMYLLRNLLKKAATIRTLEEFEGLLTHNGKQPGFPINPVVDESDRTA